MMVNIIIVETKIGSQDAAHTIAQALVERRLAAAAQVCGPIASTYWWKGRIEQAQEWACTAKTREDLYSLLEQAIRELCIPTRRRPFWPPRLSPAVQATWRGSSP